MRIINLLKNRKTIIEEALNYYLPEEKEYPQSLHKAMRYSVFAGGKRIRPILVLLSAELFSAHWEKAIPAACALELIHTYSLIHDDLPAMDNDDYRRGCPTLHKVFGEAMAILAGDALLTLAFEILTAAEKNKKEFHNAYREEVSPEIKLQIIAEVARAAGIKGMIGGQVVDLESEGKSIAKETLEYIDSHKTGALLEASLRIGAILVGARAKDLQKLSAYAQSLGNAFQIVDDLLDVEGDEKKMGKPTGMDAQKEKATAIAFYGLEETKKKRDQLYFLALQQLAYFAEKAAVLRELTRFIFYRDF